MSEPIKFNVQVEAQEAYRYPDMKMRLLIRQIVTNATLDITLDEALDVLRQEVTYFEDRIKATKP